MVQLGKVCHMYAQREDHDSFLIINIVISSLWSWNTFFITAYMFAYLPKCQFYSIIHKKKHQKPHKRRIFFQHSSEICSNCKILKSERSVFHRPHVNEKIPRTSRSSWIWPCLHKIMRKILVLIMQSLFYAIHYSIFF